MTTIGLFGGSFNPPHIAHELVALYVLETQPVDELWFVPVYAHPFGKELAPYDHRVAMLERIAATLGPRAKVSRAEQELAQRPDFIASRTLDLVEYLTAPDRALRLVVGADILGETAKWHRWTDVVAKAPLIAIGRSGFEAPPGSTVTGVTMPEISATHVRELLARHGDSHPELAQLLPKDILRYIADHHLYQAAP
ncbi:MAG TPA: nicotinate-nicotinamide nucleotide adenylyltransferase [Kofleriaceae bacterium]|nr:nicotinate-nicotinamide nucleotide adenylyltransferase [Kofleriaceae bacterium]